MLRDCLRGLRVLDFSHVVAGPVCAMMLGDMGADVTKIEPPSGEIGRDIGPPWIEGESVVALSVNRNKRGLAIDLKDDDARRVVRRLAERADVVIESFRPGVMKRLGLDYDTLKAGNPALVYCSISAYGQTGPWRGKAGVDGIIQAVSGLMSGLGEEGAGPSKVGIPIADMATAYLATVATLGALHQVRAGGAGQQVDVSLYNATLMLQQIGLSFFLATGEEPRKSGSAAPYAAPNEAFPTADGWLMVAAYQPVRWKALCQVLALPALVDDVRFIDNASRVAHRGALHDVLAEAFRQRRTADWIDTLDEADILCAPIARYGEVTASPTYRDSGIEIEVQHPVAGTVRMPGFGLGDRGVDARPVRPPPLVGQHSREVLASYGIDSADIDALMRRGAVTTTSASAAAVSDPAIQP